MACEQTSLAFVILTFILRPTDHFVFPPAPLEVHAAVKPPLEDRPAAATRLHVTVHLEEKNQGTLTIKINL